MFDGSCPFLSFVKQKTFINVHEKGTEAAAVTAGAVVTMLPPPEQPTLFMANRPFQFLIYDDTADLVLFEGHVGAPDIPEGSVAELEAQHEDEDFWLEHFVEEPSKDLEPAVKTVLEQLDGDTKTDSNQFLRHYYPDNSCEFTTKRIQEWTEQNNGQ